MSALFAGVVGVFGQLGLRGPDMYRPLFVLYALIGLLNLAVFIGLSDRVESAKIHGGRRFIGFHRSAGVVTKLSLLMSLDAFAVDWWSSR